MLNLHNLRVGNVEFRLNLSKNDGKKASFLNFQTVAEAFPRFFMQIFNFFLLSFLHSLIHPSQEIKITLETHCEYFFFVYRATVIFIHFPHLLPLMLRCALLYCSTQQQAQEKRQKF